MADPLSYNSFNDPHLQTYFGNRNVRKHLRKVGLINRHGEIIPSNEYQSIINERSRQEHVRALLSNGIVQRVIQLEKTRQATIRNQFDIEAKKLLVENVKESRQQYKELRSTDFIRFSRPKTANISKNPTDQKQLKIIDDQKLSPSRVSSLHPPRSSARTIRHHSPKINKSHVNIIRNDRCELTMIYLGGQTSVDSNNNRVEIVIMQQHCGGENVILFKNFVKPNEKFRFESRRHNDYPFALSLYIDGLIDCRISVCCEYKHKFGSPLGGKRASFAILNVQGGKPCQRCRFNEYVNNYPLIQTKLSEQNSQITNASKSRISDHSSCHRLLRTPSPYDENEVETLISNENDENNEAEEMYKKLLEKLNENVDGKEKGYFHCQLGNICKEGFGDYEKSLEHYLISLEILCESISPLDCRLRNLYLSIAHILLLQGENQNQLSIKYFQRILLIDQSLKKVNEKNLINDHHYLALLYQNEKNYSKSLFHLNKVLQYFSLIKSKTNSNENSFFNNYLINETIYDKKALKSLSIESLPDLAEVYLNLATIYFNSGEKSKALKHADKALQLSKKDQNKFETYQIYFNKLQLN